MPVVHSQFIYYGWRLKYKMKILFSRWLQTKKQHSILQWNGSSIFSNYNRILFVIFLPLSSINM